MTQDEDDGQLVRGKVKWFDPGKGFGFVVSDHGGPDILLHSNVLRNFGQSSVADGAMIEINTQQTNRGVQAISVVKIEPPDISESTFEEVEDQLFEDGDDEDLEPAWVKWFDKGKGFGFANVFGRSDDVFVHIEVLRRSGLADLQPGEAVCLRVVHGKRGSMAARVTSWDYVVKNDTDDS